MRPLANRLLVATWIVSLLISRGASAESVAPTDTEDPRWTLGVGATAALGFGGFETLGSDHGSSSGAQGELGPRAVALFNASSSFGIGTAASYTWLPTDDQLDFRMIRAAIHGRWRPSGQVLDGWWLGGDAGVAISSVHNTLHQPVAPTRRRLAPHMGVSLGRAHRLSRRLSFAVLATVAVSMFNRSHDRPGTTDPYVLDFGRLVWLGLGVEVVFAP